MFKYLVNFSYPMLRGSRSGWAEVVLEHGQVSCVQDLEIMREDIRRQYDLDGVEVTIHDFKHVG